MKKFLPKTANNPQGFTLIELLVAITIISILSVIGVVVYSTVTARARDSRRVADIDAIANALETNYTAGGYTALAAAQFQGNKVPLDPINGGSSANCGTAGMCLYCSMSAVQSSRFDACVAANIVGVGVPGAGSTYVVCTNLEGNNGPGGANFYCRKNAQ